MTRAYFFAGSGTGAVGAGAAGGATVGAAGAFLPKSTFGAVVTARSFSTCRFGFTSKPNIFAVRLLGKSRTVMLYDCTDLMYRWRATAG